MPCNIGYRQIAKIAIPKPQSQEFKEKVKPPEIDEDLLEKIGDQDPVFAQWLGELKINPLLKAALDTAVTKVRGARSLSFSITKNGNLIIGGRFASPEEKRNVESLVTQLSNQFQMEVLAIIVQLLDYEITLMQEEQDKKIVLTLEGEKEAASGIHKYLKITRNSKGEGVFIFEHFASAQELTAEQQKFLALAQKLGIKIVIHEVEKGGQAIPIGTKHKDFLKEGQ